MLHIPFAAIKGFFDPSVQFGLQFDPATAPDERDAEEAEADAQTEEAADGAAPAEASGEKVISLDAFRKKP
ncbi:Stringent starvation protein B [compost metagenome]